MRYFTLDLSATDAAHLTSLTRKSVNTIFLRIRQRIAQDWIDNGTGKIPSHLDESDEKLQKISTELLALSVLPERRGKDIIAIVKTTDKVVKSGKRKAANCARQPIAWGYWK